MDAWLMYGIFKKHENFWTRLPKKTYPEMKFAARKKTN